MTFMGKNLVFPVMTIVWSQWELDESLSVSAGDILHMGTNGYLTTSTTGTHGNYPILKDATTGAGEHILVDVLWKGVANVKVKSDEADDIQIGEKVYVDGTTVTATDNSTPVFGEAVTVGGKDEWIAILLG